MKKITLWAFAALVLCTSMMSAQTRFNLTALGAGRAADLVDGNILQTLSQTITYSLRWERTNERRLILQYSPSGSTGPWRTIFTRNAQLQTVPVAVGDTTNANPGNLVFRPIAQTDRVGSGFLRLVNDTLNPTVLVTHNVGFTVAPPPTPVGVDSVLRGIIPAGRRVQLSRNKLYGLDGYVYVDSGAVLAIDPGTIIVGDTAGQNSAICINRGGIIFARGTAQAPIIFTSSSPAGLRRGGDWGGILICGFARNNQGQMALEGGIAETQTGGRGWHGGTNDNDSSGVMEYCRIEFGGIAAFPNQELNGLTLGSVGRRSQINFVQVSFANDDSFEWFGGSVNHRNLIAWRGIDDDWDTDNGYSGRVQFALSVRDPQIADQSTSQAFESDNDANSSFNTPRTSAIFSNVTAIGPLSDTSQVLGTGAANWSALYGNGAQIRRSSLLSIVNSVFAGWPRGGLELNGTGTQNAANGDSLVFRNNTMVGLKGAPLVLVGATATPTTWITTTAFSNRVVNGAGNIATYALLPNPFVNSNSFSAVPTSNGTLYDGASFAATPNVPINDPFFTQVNYRGAFAPGAPRWDLGWTSYDPTNFDYVAGGQTTSVRDAQGNPIPSISKLDVTVFPNPTTSVSTIRYNLLATERVTVRIVNTLGALVATVFEGRQQSKGIYEFALNVESVPTGTYFVQILTTNGMVSQHLNIVR